MPVVDCAFETDRLLADEWHSMPPQSWQRQDLDRVVSQMLTGSVTQPLPESWHGRYTLERTQLWIAERDAEGTALLVVEKSSRKAIGLLFMAWFNVSDGVEIRVGYLLAEPRVGEERISPEYFQGRSQRRRGHLATVAAKVTALHYCYGSAQT